jgi:hypothetical protein
MAAPVLTLDNLADHVAAYRARIEQRRVAIESRPREKRFALAEPPQESKEFLEALFSTRSFSLPPQPQSPGPASQMFNAIAGARQLTPEETLAAKCDRVFERLGREFVEAARDGDGDLVRAFIEEGFPMQFFDQRTRETALHAAAGSRARPAIRVLVQHWPDFLMRDHYGRLSSELAYLYGEDPAMAHMLGIKERKQAKAKGGDPVRRIYAYRAH